MLDLHRESDWVARRVETVTFHTSTDVERQITMDLDGDRLGALAIKHGFTGGADLPVPLAKLLPKSLLLDIDVRDGSDAVVPVCTSDVDSCLAQVLILAAFEAADVSIESAPDNFLAGVLQAVSDMPADGDRSAIEGSRRATQATAAEALAQVRSWESIIEWGAAQQALVRDQRLRLLLVDFTLNYAPRVRISAGAGTQIVKYRTLEFQDRPSRSEISDRLAIASYSFSIDAPSVGTAQREHLRVIAPAELFIEGIALLIPELSTAYGGGDSEPSDRVSRFYYETRITPGRGVLYTRNFWRGDYKIILYLRARQRGFLRSSQYTVFASALLLLAGALAQHFGHRLSNAEGSSEAAITLLATAPSLASAFFAQDTEHELVSDYLRAARVLVVGSTGAAALAGGALVIGIASHLALVWLVASAVSAAVWSLLRWTSWKSKRKFVAVARKARSTTHGYLVVTSRKETVDRVFVEAADE